MSEPSKTKTYEGAFAAPAGARFAVVAARFNHAIVDRLLAGALDGLRRHGVPSDGIVVARVPGAWELPVTCQQLAQSGRFRAVIALGAVIRGATPHFDFVAAEAARGCARVALDTSVPVVFGVLTTDTIEQALERSGTKAGNKGFDSALAALEMVSLCAALDADGIGGGGAAPG